MAEFQLSENDKHNPLWLRLKAHLEARLGDKRRKNDSQILTEQQTAALRGEIACLKGIIALADERPVIPTEI